MAWHSRSDYEETAQAFLNTHRLKDIFLKPLVRFLEVTEDEAAAFPVRVEADLIKIFERHSQI